MRLAAWCGGFALALTLYVAWHGTPVPGDVRGIRELQDIGFFYHNQAWVNALGLYPWQVFLAVATILVAALGKRIGVPASPKDRMIAIWTLLLALALRILSNPLKEMAQATRPSLDFHIRVTQDFPGYGYPSGHVYGDVLMYGALAVVAPRLAGAALGAAARVFCVAIIVMSGPARMTIGAHWPSDVLGGYLWGATALCLAVAGGRRLAGQR
jgi:undecaprenyl-diphosphatase